MNSGPILEGILHVTIGLAMLVGLGLFAGYAIDRSPALAGLSTISAPPLQADVLDAAPGLKSPPAATPKLADLGAVCGDR